MFDRFLLWCFLLLGSVETRYCFVQLSQIDSVLGMLCTSKDWLKVIKGFYFELQGLSAGLLRQATYTTTRLGTFRSATYTLSWANFSVAKALLCPLKSHFLGFSDFCKLWNSSQALNVSTCVNRHYHILHHRLHEARYIDGSHTVTFSD